MGVKVSEAELSQILARPGYSVLCGDASTPSPRRNKYNAQRVSFDGLTFASKAEMARYGELRLLELTGAIAGLECQPRFTLTGGVIYVADFRYVEGERVIVEDVKGVQTRVFINKWKQVKVLYPSIEFRIVER